MRREHLQHIVLEIGERFGCEEFYVVGSAAILAAYPALADEALIRTRDVDVIPLDGDERLADRISWVLGEGSDFDQRFGYHAQGVSPTTPRYAPADWHARVIPVSVGRYRALCMEPHDLLLSKLGAGRDKDLEFAHAAVAALPIDRKILLERLESVNASDDRLALIAARIEALFGH